MHTPILQTNNLTIGYKHSKNGFVTVQKNVNIRLEKGKLISLVGINGIGKSTLLRTLSANQKSINGQIVLKDKNLQEYTNSDLAKIISVVLTERIPLSDLTVQELIQIGRTPYLNHYSKLTEEDIYWVNQAIDLTGITDLKEKKIDQLSDGQLQRVLIARALAQNTPIIILDEPTNHLDLHHKVALFKLLKDLAHKQNKAILFSCHDMDLAIQLSDEIIVLKQDYTTQGKTEALIETGVFDNFFEDENLVFDRPQKRFILNL